MTAIATIDWDAKVKRFRNVNRDLHHRDIIVVHADMPNLARVYNPV